MIGQSLNAELQVELRLIERAARMHWLHWLVVAGSLVLTISAWYISRTSIQGKIEDQFERESRQVVELVSERMQKYEDALWSGIAAIQSHGGDVPYPTWKTFANSLQIDVKYPGINGIGVIHYVAPETRGDYLAAQQTLRPDYRIHPTHARDEYWPITYIEPAAVNAAAVGLDMAHESNRYRAAIKARDSGRARITGPIVLVQDANRTPGFLFFAPFYNGGPQPRISERRDSFTGLVYAPFVVKNLMEGTLRKESRTVGIRILDGDQILYDEHDPSVEDFDSDPLYANYLEVDMYGREWLFDVRSKTSFREATANNQPLVILFGGIAIDTLLLVLFLLLANANQRAVRFIHQVID